MYALIFIVNKTKCNTRFSFCFRPGEANLSNNSKRLNLDYMISHFKSTVWLHIAVILNLDCNEIK